MAFSFPFVSFSNVKFPCNTAHHSSTSSFLAPTSSHFVSPLRQVCHMSCVHFGLTRMCPTSSGGTLDSRFSFLVSGFCIQYSGGSDARPGNCFKVCQSAVPAEFFVCSLFSNCRASFSTPPTPPLISRVYFRKVKMLGILMKEVAGQSAEICLVSWLSLSEAYDSAARLLCIFFH